MKDERLYLIHISECIEKIEEYLDQTTKEAFLDSTLIQDAVLHNLQILAESTQRLPENIKQKQPAIDWYKIAGLRNILVHDYLGVEMETVWNIIEKELPTLKKAIRSMLD